jgi:hypothetical protein
MSPAADEVSIKLFAVEERTDKTHQCVHEIRNCPGSGWANARNKCKENPVIYPKNEDVN